MARSDGTLVHLWHIQQDMPRWMPSWPVERSPWLSHGGVSVATTFGDSHQQRAKELQRWRGWMTAQEPHA